VPFISKFNLNEFASRVNLAVRSVSPLKSELPSKLFDAFHSNFTFDSGMLALIMAASSVVFRPEVVTMKNAIFILVFLALNLPTNAAPQHSSKAAESKRSATGSEGYSKKAITLSGQVSGDGKTFLTNEDDILVISNAGVLAGYEGQYVSLRCRVNSSKSEIYVFSAKAAVRDAKYVTKPGDSAFRR